MRSPKLVSGAVDSRVRTGLHVWAQAALFTHSFYTHWRRMCTWRTEYVTEPLWSASRTARPCYTRPLPLHTGSQSYMCELHVQECCMHSIQ